MLSNYKSKIESNLQSTAKKFSWLNPNIITIVGILPQIFFFYFMSNHMWGFAIFMLILTPLDMLDGILARANNRATAFGGFLDSTLDRIGDFFIIAGLYAGGLTNLTTAAGLVLASFLISYARSRAELASSQKQIFNYGIIERPERILYILIVVVIHALWPNASLGNYNLTMILILLLLLLSILTFLQRIYYAYKKL